MDRYAAGTHFQPSNVKQAFKDAQANGHVLFGCGMGIPTPLVVRMVATLGFDWMWIDAEHSPLHQSDLAELIRTVNFYSEGKTFPVVRVPSCEPTYVAWALDAGAGAFMVPHVESAEEVRNMINWSHYPPIGTRSFAPFAHIPGFTDRPGNALQTSNAHVGVIPQIESQKGIDNLDEICQFEQVSAIMIGTGDLSLDLGLPLGHDEEAQPKLKEALLKISAIAKKHNKPLLGFVPAHLIERRIELGYRVICSSADQFTLAFGLVGELAQQRETAKKMLGDKQGTNGKA